MAPVELEERLAQSIQHANALDAERHGLRVLLDLVPANVTVHLGPDLVFALSNARHQTLVGDRALLGKPLDAALPELVSQGIIDSLRNVYRSGAPHFEKELQVELLGRDGEVHHHIMNVALQPLRDAHGSVSGVMTFSYDVTEQVLARQRAEKLASAVAEGEELFRASHEASPHGFVYHRIVRDSHEKVVDLEYVVQNAAASRINGLPPGRECEGRRVLATFPGLADETLWQHYVQVATTGETWSGEVHYRGEHIDHWFQMTAVRVGAGLAVTFEDVSARKATEVARDELHAAQQRAQREAELAREHTDAFYRQAPAAIAVWRGPDHTFQLANARYLEMVGRHDVLGRTLRDVFDGPMLSDSTLQEVFDHVFATGESFVAPEYEVQIQQRGESHPSRRVFSFSLGPMRDEGTKIVGLVAVAFDVTEQVVARERNAALADELSASEARFRTALEMSPDGFMMFRSVRERGVITDFTWAFTNPAAERMLGRSHAELLHKRLLHEMPGNAAEGLFEAYVSVVETGAPFRRELQYGHEGLSQAFRILAVRLEDGFAVTFEDVTERKRAEAERELLLATLQLAREDAEAQRALAEAANTLKDEFLATISHELRTPLQAILGWSAVLRSDTAPSAERLAKGLDVIERNARSQAAIIEDILDVSRIITGKLQLAEDDVDIAAEVHAAIDTLRPAADGKRIDLKVVIESDVGTIRGDAGRLQQAIWNLVGNAIKFTPPMGTVHVTLHRIERYVVMRVTDSGQGISAEFLPHVFERFRQADGSSTRAKGGLGLGLAIVRQLVELHGGSVEAASDGEGCGATFWMKLPVTERLSGRTSVRPALVQVPGPSQFEDVVDLTGSRIVVVDDEDDAREVVAMILREAGAEVRAVGSGGEALACVAAWEPDLLFADISMPGQDGHALVRAVRALTGAGRGVRAIALTASAMDVDRAAALRAGFDDFVAKPANRRVLLALARRVPR